MTDLQLGVGSVQVSVLNAFQVELLSALQPYIEPATFAAGERIFGRGDPGDAFYVIDDGEVRLESHSDEMDTDATLDYVGSGSFLGEVAVLGGGLQSLTAIAESPVTARRVTTEGLKRLFREDPAAGVDVLRAMSRETAMRLDRAHERITEHLADEAPDPVVEEMVARAVEAQREFESWDEERVDALLGAMADKIAAHAQELAELTVEQTTLGNVPDKVAKITFASKGVYDALAGEVGFGALAELPDKRVSEFASPVGVVLALVPVTNPAPTFINKALISLKARNAVILSCHRMALGVGNRTGELIQEVLDEHGAPQGIVQWIRKRTSRRTTAKFMRHDGVGLILATGGPGMVKAAYSSGKPAIGVGAGNAPAWIAADADAAQAAGAVVLSKAFDYGLICGSEQHLVVDRSVEDALVDALREQGAVVLDDAGTQTFMDGAFDDHGDLKMEFVGRSAETIAAAVGLEGAEGARLLVFRADASNPEGAQARERLAPVLSLFTVDGDDEGIALCRQLLLYHGAGHTANIHTASEERIERFTAAMPVGRVLVNLPSAAGCCGLMSGLPPSLTLGCGTFGNNSTTDNVTHANLMNVKRLARSLQ